MTSALAAAIAVGAPAAAQQPVQPYTDPPFSCEFHHFGEAETPPIGGIPDDPLCVEYEKRDITVTNGGAVAFLLAEPARFAAALPKCQYWQIDHWSVQVAPGQTALVSWDGSYWFDKGAGRGAVLARNFQVGGQPADGDQLADALEPAAPELAAAIREYSAEDGGGGMTFTLPGGDPTCAPEAPGPEPTDAPTATPREEPQDEPDEPGPLAATGGGAAFVGALGLATAAVLRHRRRS